MAAKRKPSAAFMKPVQPNEKLAFGGKQQVSMFEMTKLVSKNIT